MKDLSRMLVACLVSLVISSAIVYSVGENGIYLNGEDGTIKHYVDGTVDWQMPLEGNYTSWSMMWNISFYNDWSSYCESCMAISVSEKNNIVIVQDFYRGSTARCYLNNGSFIDEDYTLGFSNLFTPQTMSLSRYVVGLFFDGSHHRLLKVWKDGELIQTTDLSDVAGFATFGSVMLQIAITRDGKYIGVSDYQLNVFALFEGS